MHVLSSTDCTAVAGGASLTSPTANHVEVFFPEPMPGMPYRKPLFPPLNID